MVKSLLLLRIAAAATTAFGAGVALFGDTRAATGLTDTGYLAVAAVIAGFVATTAIELLQVNTDRRQRNEEAHERQISEGWRLAEQQQIRALSIHFCHRRELPVVEFMKLMARLSIAIRSHSDDGRRMTNTTLKFVQFSADSDAECAYRLVATRDANVIGLSDGVSLAARGRVGGPEPLRQQTTSTIEAQTAPTTRAPNAESENPRNRLSLSPVAAVSLMCGDWNYELSNEQTSWVAHSLACGIRATIPWHDLALGSRYETIQGLAQLFELTVTLPSGFDLRIADWFELSVDSVEALDAAIDLRTARFAEWEDGSWQVSVGGRVLYALCRTRFLQRFTLGDHGSPTTA